MRIGADIVVKDADGTIIAAGAISQSVGGKPGFVNRARSRECIFRGSVDNVPESDFYSIEVSHRGAKTYSKAELAASNWALQFTLG